MANNRNLFGFFPILTHLIIIAIAIIAYYFILKNDLFYDWQTFVFYGLKGLIILEIILASARSFLAPILGILVSAAIVFSPDLTGQSVSMATSGALTISDGWLLLVVSLFGLLITALMKLK